MDQVTGVTINRSTMYTNSATGKRVRIVHHYDPDWKPRYNVTAQEVDLYFSDPVLAHVTAVSLCKGEDHGSSTGAVLGNQVLER